MYERMVQEVAASPTAVHTCHDFEQLNNNKLKKANTEKVNTDYFNAKIQCDYKCTNSESKSVELLEEFRPRNLSLLEGDGSSKEKVLWRSLGVTIKIWAKEECYYKAVEECDSKVESIATEKVSSGDWSWDTKLNCKQKEVVYSPFDERFQLANNGQATYQTFQLNPFSANFSSDKPINKLEEFFIDRNENDLKALYDNTECKNPIKIHSCFGDCVFENKKDQNKWSETLSTTEHLGTNDFTICADEFNKKVKNENYSRDIRTFKCEKFVWEYMRKTELMGSSCAALRLETNCDKI